jgi:hypothetical protein
MSKTFLLKLRIRKIDTWPISCPRLGGDLSPGIDGDTGAGSVVATPAGSSGCGCISLSSSSESSLAGSGLDSQRPLIFRILAASCGQFYEV